MAQQLRILVIKLSALGDFIIALPAMRAIRAHHPDAHITLLTTHAFESIARQSGLFNDIQIDARAHKANLGAWIRLRRIFKDGHFDRVYDLQNNARTALYFRLSQTLRKKPQWAGTMAGATWRDIISSKRTDPAHQRHAHLLSAIGITDLKNDPLDWMGGSHDDLQNTFELPEPYILIVPGCAPSRPEKRWPAHYYGDLCRRLYGWGGADAGLTPVIIGTRDEDDLARIIQTHCPQAINLTGQTAISDLPMLARHAAAMIGNDTGPIHIMAPTGCPTWVLFSHASTPSLHAPPYEWVRTIQRDNLHDLGVDDVMDYLQYRDFKITKSS